MKRKLIQLFLTVFLINFISCQSADSLRNASPYKIGKVTIDEILQTSEKFKKGYDGYTPSKEYDIPSGFKIVVIFGFWCHDSKREIPRLLKTLKHFNASDDMITLYSTNRKKTQPAEIIKQHEVFYSPTIIFYNGDKEVRRFVEFPDTTWENDIIKYSKVEE